MEYKYATAKKGMYIDGHKREDVVEDRCEALLRHSPLHLSFLTIFYSNYIISYSPSVPISLPSNSDYHIPNSAYKKTKSPFCSAPL